MSSATVTLYRDENNLITRDASKPVVKRSSPNRRVLGHVSPNVRHPPNPHNPHNRPLAGSPLKRSFTAAIEQNAGFVYLKRRRLSEDAFDPESQPAPRRPAFNNPDSIGDRLNDQIDAAMNDQFLPHIREASPTEVDSASEHEESPSSSNDRKSFSSLINYNPSSQPRQHPLNQITRAEMLALRLRVAMYKVRTDQIDVPFEELRVAGPDGLKQSTSAAVEEAVAALRRQAQADDPLRDDAARPKLLPAPILKPTKYSSRMVYETPIPSSPPAAMTPNRHDTPRNLTTPKQMMRRAWSTPPNSVDRTPRNFDPDAELTSSAVKGRVAEGLLGLRNSC